MPGGEANANAFALEPRTDRPQGRFDLLVALCVAGAAAGVYVAALFVRTVPDQAVAAAFLTVSPVLCLVGLWVYRSVSRDLASPQLQWAGAGLLVCFAALTLQFVSFPVVAPDGGPLGTDADSSAALYLLFHAALFAAAAAGALDAGVRWARWFSVVGCLLAVALAVNLVPLPVLIDEAVLFTPVLIGIEVVLAAAGAVCAVLWVARAGRDTTPLVGWFAVTLAFSVADVALNALAAERFQPVWWASLSMRVASFAVLAVGSISYLLRDRRRWAQYTETELTRREAQLIRTAQVTRRLMDNAAGLSRAVSPAEVALVLADTALDLCDCERVLVVERDTGGGVQVLASRGYDPDSLELITALVGDPTSPAGAILSGGPSVHLSGHDEVVAGFPALKKVPAQQHVARLAAAPMRAAGSLQGALVVSGDRQLEWDQDSRAVLAALAAQGGPALARARLHAQEHGNAISLQRVLLPSRLPDVPDLEVAHRYVPADTAASVGGDWYDVQELADGRWLITVGDVVGKGIDAAATMGTIRHTIRGLALLEPRPGALLDHLDQVLAGTSGQMATIVAMLWEPATRTFTYARAGHMPILLLPADGGSSLLEDAGSLPLGLGDQHRPEAALTGAPGDTLVLYTDGLVERRDASLEDTLQQMRRSAERSVHSGAGPEELADNLIAERPTGDDVALVVISVRPGRP